MTPERWQKVKEIIASAIEQPISSRPDFLREACGSDDELRLEVESFLQYQDLENGFFEKEFELTDPADDCGFIGKQIGKYKIIGEIRQGGMGAVFLAERADGEFSQEVAVKFLRQAFSNTDSKRKFIQERQILARLHHPYIAQLLDGGTSDDGTPYLVMEYIAGQPITTFATENDLNLNEKLDLFRKVCQAVTFAHQNLIVHRDLKPDNILITPDGTPKLLDFGIAKLLSNSDILATLTQVRAFTPEYAAPEQIAGLPVTTATDVYSLGVILYELLNGERPSGITDSKLQIPNSTKQTRNQRPKTIFGDLQKINAKALHPESSRRYASVEQLSEDIRRFQNGLPILARPDTFGYRSAKFFQRHKIPAFAAFLIFTALISGAGVASWQAKIARDERAVAERRAADLQRLSQSFIVEIHDDIVKLPGSLPVRQKLLQRGIEQLDRLAAESGNNPKVLDNLAKGYYQLSEMPDLNISEVERNRHKAIGIYQSLLENEPDNLEYQMALAEGWLRLANSQKILGKIKEALEYARKSNSLLQTVAAREPGNFDYQYALWSSHYETAALLTFTGNSEPALEESRRALKLAEKVKNLAPQREETRAMETESRRIMAVNLSDLGDYDNSLAEVEKIQAIYLKDYQSDPENVIRRYEMFLISFRIGKILAQQGLIDQGLQKLRAGQKFIEDLAAASPQDTGYRRNLAYALYSTAEILLDAQRHSEALADLQKALEISEKIYSNDSKRGETLKDLAIIYSGLGECLHRLGKPEESLKYHGKSLEFFSALSPDNSPDAVLKRSYQNELKRFEEMRKLKG